MSCVPSSASSATSSHVEVAVGDVIVCRSCGSAASFALSRTQRVLEAVLQRKGIKIPRTRDGRRAAAVIQACDSGGTSEEEAPAAVEVDPSSSPPPTEEAAAANVEADETDAATRLLLQERASSSSSATAQGEGEEVEGDDGYGSDLILCPVGHAMGWNTEYDSGWRCDVCWEAIPAKEAFCECRECRRIWMRWKVCEECAAQREWLVVGEDKEVTPYQACLERMRLNDATLANVGLNCRKLGQTNIERLSGAIAGNVTVRRLFLSGNAIGAVGAGHIASFLRVNTTLEELDISMNDLGKIGTKRIADALQHSNRSLCVLNLSRNRVGDDCCVAHLAELLGSNASLRTLILSHNEIGDRGASALASVLGGNSSATTIEAEGSKKGGSLLRDLDLDWNQIGPAGAQAFLNALSSRGGNCSLTRLALNPESIGTDLAVRIGMVTGTNSVRNSHLQGIGGEGASYYLSVLSRSRDDHGISNRSQEGFSTTRNSTAEIDDDNDKLCLEWRASRIREAVTGDGRALSALLRVLRHIVASCGGGEGWEDREGTEHSPLPEKLSDGDLAKALGDPEARRALVDRSLDGRGMSTILHLAAAAEADCALDVCQILVGPYFRANFSGIEDGVGRSARTIAMANGNPKMVAWAQSIGTFLGRYWIEGGAGMSSPPAHRSATCTVYFAIDVTKKKGDQDREVAIKIMARPHQFRRELAARLLVNPETIGSGEDIDNEKKRNRFDEDKVVKLLRYHDETNEQGQPIMCLVMPMADKSMDIIIRSERVAGRELYLIKHFAMSTVRALMHLHSEHNLLHGDIKPRNIVRTDSGLGLIDFDMSIPMGDPVGTDKVSTGYCPPELAKALFVDKGNLKELEMKRNGLLEDMKHVQSSAVKAFVEEELIVTENEIAMLKSGTPELPKAHPTFDVWSFGVVMYYLFTGTSLFKLDDADNLCSADEKRKLVQWEGLNSTHLRLVLANCSGVTRSQIRDAKDLLVQCLKPNPCDRPQSMHGVLSTPFFSRASRTSLCWTPSQRNCIRVLTSDPLVWMGQDGNYYPADRLNFSRERGLLINCLKRSGKNVQLSFDVATDTRLQELATERCGCLHFSGHGVHIPDDGEYLLFEDGSGCAHLLGTDELQKLLEPCSKPFKFVFISACLSEHIGRAFVDAGVPHVVCCDKASVLMDDAAADFMRTFYSVLVMGETVRAAFDSAKGIVASKHGGAESDKFLLLPDEGKHELALLDPDELDWEEEEWCSGRHIPHPPPHFCGRELIMHQIVAAMMTEDRLFTIVGESGSGRSSLASAVSCYLQDRLSGNKYIEDVVYLQKDNSTCGVQDYLCCLNDQLFSDDGVVQYGNEESTTQRICSFLQTTRTLVVFDGIDIMEDAVNKFLRSLFQKTANVKVLLTARECSKYSSAGVLERVFPLGPLEYRNAVWLFTKICPHTNKKVRSLLNGISPEKFAGFSKESSHVVMSLQAGSPTVIMEAAQHFSKDDCHRLVTDLERV